MQIQGVARPSRADCRLTTTAFSTFPGKSLVLAACRPLEHDCDPLTDTDTQSDERVAAAAAFELTHGEQYETGTRIAERMADRDRPAVWIDARVVERQS